MGNSKNKKLSRVWKTNNPDLWESSKQKIIIIERNTFSKKWQSQKGDWCFQAEIIGIKLELSKYMVGKPESYGGRSLLAKHFLEKEKWQSEVVKYFGQEVFNEIYNVVKNNYCESKNT
jgi:hypothetical protein